MRVPPISFSSSLSTVHLIAPSIKHNMRRGVIGNERRRDLEALHMKVTGRAKGRVLNLVFSSCGFCQAQFCLVHCYAPDSSQKSAHSHPKLVSAATIPRGKVKLLTECKGFLIWLTAYSGVAEHLLAGHK